VSTTLIIIPIGGRLFKEQKKISDAQRGLWTGTAIRLDSP